MLFAVLTACFLLWGVAADLTTPMVAGFQRIFDMSTFQASLVQLAYFGAYFLLALPAAFINERFGYKVGLLSGLGLAAIGSFAFYPASLIQTYEAFLVALFAMAAGCSILETSANPYVMSLGPEETGTRRLNFAQAFNPLGTNIGVLLAATLILPKLDEPVDLTALSEAEIRVIRAGELGAVMGPTWGCPRCWCSCGWSSCSASRRPSERSSPTAWGTGAKVAFGILFRTKRYRFGGGGAVLQRGRAGVRVDLHHPVHAAGGEREPLARRGGAADQPDHLLDQPVRDDVGDRQGPGDEGADAAGGRSRCCCAWSRWPPRTWWAWWRWSRCRSACR